MSVDERDRLTVIDHVRGWLSQRRWGPLGKWWRRRQRSHDREGLWPAIYNAAFWDLAFGLTKDEAHKTCGERSREAQALHIYLDSAWRFRDEWANEPEAAWAGEALARLGRKLNWEPTQ